MTGYVATSDSTRPTVDEILAARDAAVTEIYAKAQELSDRAVVLQGIRGERPLTAAEEAELADIDRAQQALSDAERKVMRVAVAILDRSDEVKRLIGVVTGVNADLKARLKEVQNVAKNIKKVGDMLGAVEAVVQALTKLAKFLV